MQRLLSLKVKCAHSLKFNRKEETQITNHRANREELNQLIEEYQETMNDYISTTIRSIKAIHDAQKSVSTRTIEPPTIPVLDSLRVLMDIGKINLYWSAMKKTDEVGNKNFLEANTEMLEVKKVAKDFYEGLGKNGGNLSSLDINELQSNLFNENELMDVILEKLNADETLSDSEDRILYYYIQNQLFDDEKRETMNIIIKSLETNSELLISHLNDNVLKTEASLYEEILLTEMYLYTGNQHPKDGHLSRKEHSLLSSYLETLYHYRSALEEVKEVDPWLKNLDPDDPLLAKVELYDYIKPNEPQAYYIETIFRIGKYTADDSYGRDDFLADDDQLLASLYYNSKISHYESGDDLLRENNLKARDNYANHTKGFINAQILSVALDVLLKGSPLTGFIDDSSNFASARSEKHHQMTQRDAELAANTFGLEVQVLERESKTSRYVPYEMQFLPTKETYEIMDRWKEAIDSGSEIPYPEEELSQEDWFLISDFYHRNQTEMRNSFSEEYDYIFNQ